MPKGVYAVASAMIQEQRALDAVAENIANARSSGYRQVHALRRSFADLLAAERGRSTDLGNDGGAGVGVAQPGTWRDFSRGQIENTGSPLDMAIDGEGMFILRREDGELLLSRDGGFNLDANRQLVNAQGWTVQGQGGPIVVPEEARSVTVDAGGRVYAELPDGQSFIDQLRITRLDHERLRQLQPINGQHFLAGDTRLDDAETAVVQQGFRESSNVDPVQELVRMVDLQRRSDAAQRALTSQLQLSGIGDILRGG
jgi:flagellar basal-body rod protein FlgF